MQWCRNFVVSCHGFFAVFGENHGVTCPLCK